MRNTVKLRSKIAALLMAALVVTAGAVAYFLTVGNQKEKVSQSGLRVAPEFVLKDAQGKSHRLSDLRGKIVLLHFWASWCPPCLGEIPVWLELAQEFEGKPLSLVAISLDESWEAAHKVLPAEKVPEGVTALLDTKLEVSDRYGSYAFPETYLINERGEIVTKWVGPQDWKSPEFLKLMNSLLNANRATDSSS